jgi:putative ABC transport system permease protein
MLKNYIKIALAVLKRNKFFTFVSLLVIGVTLGIVLILVAFIDKLFNESYPDRKRDRSLYVNNLEYRSAATGGFSKSALSFYFLDHFAGELKTPVKVAISSSPALTTSYFNSQKILISSKYTNAAFWEVLDHDFLEGKPFNKQQVDNGEMVVVISEDIKRRYFGDESSVVGKTLQVDNLHYRVSGVVKNVPTTMTLFSSDIYLPYTVSKTDYNNKGYAGNYTGILLARSKSDVRAMKDEYEQLVARLGVNNPQYDQLTSSADTYFNSFISGFVKGDDKGAASKMILLFLLVTLLFMLLPALNLININITRILERASEIGVRKAFGASSRTLVFQFIVENLVITLLGGLFGLLLAVIAVRIFNNSAIIRNLDLSINFTVLLYGLLTCIFFGILSGVYPAWRMSRLSAVTALKTK